MIQQFTQEKKNYGRTFMKKDSYLIIREATKVKMLHFLEFLKSQFLISNVIAC